MVHSRVPSAGAAAVLIDPAARAPVPSRRGVTTGCPATSPWRSARSRSDPPTTTAAMRRVFAMSASGSPSKQHPVGPLVGLDGAELFKSAPRWRPADWSRRRSPPAARARPVTSKRSATLRWTVVTGRRGPRRAPASPTATLRRTAPCEDDRAMLRYASVLILAMATAAPVLAQPMSFTASVAVTWIIDTYAADPAARELAFPDWDALPEREDVSMGDVHHPAIVVVWRG